jgi:hypothetical protein
VPASFSFRDDRLVMHVNAGWLHDRDEKRDRPTWGVGAEAQITARTWLIAETFDQAAGTRYQLGVRHWLIPDHVQIDVTYGNRYTQPRENRWFTIGLRLLSNPFLP